MGRITSKKRLDIAIEAFAKILRQTDKKLHFNICGTGDENILRNSKNQITNLSISDYVSFLGWKSGTEKEEILKKSNCFILTSEDENFAIAVAETLQYGIPSIISENVALSSVVKKFNAGLVFRNLDAIEISKLMIEIVDADQNILYESAVNASEQFSWDLIGKVWERCLYECIDFSMNKK
jgi:glycosyltransferase involved in cell wall biosynthesis